jgi:hypothetical protein
MEMPQPSAGHHRLELLVGSWRGEETMYPSHWDPTGRVATGRLEWQFGIDDLFLIGGAEQEHDGVVVYKGHGVWSYNPRTDLYSLHWFDSASGLPEEFTGRFEGDRLLVGHAGHVHTTLCNDLSDPDNLRTQMRMSTDGETWTTLMDGSYRRALS